jgi:hypothetical protein
MFGVGVGVRVGGFTASSGGVTPYVGLLDSYPNAAAAYSVRLLRGGYTSNAIRVRRSSDNAEQNIGFDVNGNLDTTALTSFCSGTNGFVTTWYDQSGNGRNATQTTAANQPQIVSSGAVINVNSKPSVRFQDLTDLLSCTTATGTSINNSVATVGKFNTSGASSYGIFMSIGDTIGPCFAVTANNSFVRTLYTSAAQATDGTGTTNQEIWGTTTNSSGNKLWVNAASQTMSSATQTFTSNLNNILIGNDLFASTRLPNMQETIFWATTQSDSNIVAINNNQNTYYAVY